MAVGFVLAIRQARLQTIIDALDAAATNGRIYFYDDSRPATADDGIGVANLLGSCGLADPCGTITDSTLSFNAIAEDVSADATGTLTWARFRDGDGNTVCDMTCSLIAGSGEVKFDDVDIIINGLIRIISAAIHEPI